MKLKLIIASLLSLVLVSCGSAERSAEVSDVIENRIPAESYISPSSVFADGNGHIFASDETGSRVFMLNSDGSEAKSITLDGGAHCVKVKDGKTYVLSGGINGLLSIYENGLSGKPVEYSVGHTPTDIEFIGDKIYVTNRFSDSISEISSDGIVHNIPVGREPMAAAVAGECLYVACHLPDDAGNADCVSSSVYVLDTVSDTVRTIELVNGSGGVKDIEVTPDGDYLFVTTIVARYQYPTTQLDGAWINSNGFAVIDAHSDEYLTTVLLDDVTLGAASPWGISFGGDNVYFALSGTGEILSAPYSSIAGIIKSAVREGRETADEIGLISRLRTRTQLLGEGVRDIMYAEGKLWCAQYFTGNIAVLNEDFTISEISLGEQPEADIVRTGETLWFDATKCYQSWEACASCHPDGRVDGFNWDNLNDGLGNPKSAVSMMYSHRCPPVMVTGIRENAEAAVRAGMKYIQFNTIDEESNRAIDEYLKSLVPEDSPALKLDRTLTESAERGKELFDSYGCAVCHPAPLYTDNKLHTSEHLGTDGGWENREFATPTLVEVWRTAPYMYNGSAKTLEEAVRMSVKGEISETELADLTEFVRSIGNIGENYGVEQVFFESADGVLSQGRPKSPSSVLSSFTVRKQKNDAPVCTVRLTVSSDNGDTVRKWVLGEMQYNTAVKITLTEKLPVASGCKIKIELLDKKGKPLASVYSIDVE